MNALVVLIVLVILGACVYVIWSKTGATVSVNTNQNKDQLRDALTNFLTHRKYIAASQSENLMTYAMDKNASCILGFALLCLGLIPGILYLALGGSTKTLTVQFTPTQNGWNVRIQGQRAIVMRVQKMVAMGSPQVASTIAAPSQTAPVQIPAPMPTPVAASTPIAAPISKTTPALGASTPTSAAPVATAPRNCLTCGAQVDPGLRFCNKCGAAMS